jgi:hypothetical protein
VSLAVTDGTLDDGAEGASDGATEDEADDNKGLVGFGCGAWGGAVRVWSCVSSCSCRLTSSWYCASSDAAVMGVTESTPRPRSDVLLDKKEKPLLADAGANYQLNTNRNKYYK